MINQSVAQNVAVELISTNHLIVKIKKWFKPTNALTLAVILSLK